MITKFSFSYPAVNNLIRKGTLVAHLNYYRQKVTPKTKPWEFIRLGNEVMDIFKLFVKHVPNGLLGNRWGTLVQQQPN